MPSLVYDDEPTTKSIVWDDDVASGKQGLQDAFAAKKGYASGGGRAFANALTGGAIPFGNRITSAIGAGIADLASPLTGDPRTFNELYSDSLADTQATADANPGATLAGNLVGIAETLPLASSKVVGSAQILPQSLRGAVNAIPTGFEAASNFARGGSNIATQALRSAALAAPAGALFGAGDAAPGEMGKGAAIGGGLGFGLGASVPVLGRLAVSGGNKILNTKAIQSAKQTGELAAGSVSNATKKVYDRLLSDFGGDANALKTALNSYAAKNGQSLIENSGARTSNLAEGAAQYPSGQASATEFFDDAVGKQGERLKTSAGKNISPSANYYESVDKLVDDGRKSVAPIYSEAYKANQQVQSPVIDRILQTPEGKSALSDAVLNMQNEMALVSKSDPELTDMAREAGLASTGHGVGKGLKLRTLDYVKRSMDSTINSAKRAGDDSQVRRIQNLKSALVSELDSNDKTGLYAKARQASGDYLSAREASESGLNFLKDDHQFVKKQFDAFGPTEKKAYKMGVLKTIRGDIENKVDGQNVSRIFSKSATRQKLEAILPQKEYKALLNDAFASDKIYKLRNQIVGNSRTSVRQVARQEFENHAAELGEDIIKHGPVQAGIKKGFQLVRKMFDGLSDNLAEDVSKILYETDTKKKYAILKDLNTVSKENSPKSLNAAKKLDVYYKITDAISKNKEVAATPLAITVHPKGNK